MVQYQEYRFNGRAAIVTGAGNDVGNARAIELAKGGSNVALFCRRLAPIEEVKEECLKYTDKAIDIASVAPFFAQEDLFVSGQNLIVDGGATV